MLRFRLSWLSFSLTILSCLYRNCHGDSDPRVISFDDLIVRADKFSDPGVNSFSQLLFDVTREQIVVGARDTLYRLNTTNLRKVQKADWLSPTEKIQSCLEKGQSEDDCHNYIKILLSYGKRLFTCGTNAFSPQCGWRELEDIDKVIGTVSGIGKCPYNPRANVTALMTSGGQFFSGTEMDFVGTDAAIVRDFGGSSFLRTNQFNSKWLNEPQFVGSFETDAYVYFFFREKAVEYINCGKRIYSRIARVCKHDSGGQYILKDNWTTFIKARLNCSLPGEYPFYFDEIQGVSSLPDEGLVYATFTTARNSIPGSAICSFNLTAINQAFNGPFKHQSSISHSWEPYTSENHNPGYCSGPLDRQHMIDATKYQLMDRAVQPATQSPLYSSQLERIVHIAVDVSTTKLHRVMHIVYVSTEDNVIKKISVLPRTQRTCVLEVWKLPTSDVPAILSLHFLKQTNSLYVGTNTELMRIPAEHCDRHKTRQACLNAMDPYCGWNEIKEQCTPPPDNNPLVSYWQQSITNCPTFTHPVNGGWSSWSAWAQCTYVSSNSDSVDYCLCSHRKCDNPSPRNGGTDCEGVITQVANCTLHGGWTNWSAWSSCSESCGIAVKTRKRTCTNPAPAFGGRVCVGPDTQELYCHENPPCPDIVPPGRDGGWSAWGVWNECSAKCSGGYRFRSRRCDNPPPQKPGGLDCIGSSTEYEACNTFPCKEIKKLSNWTPWTQLGNGTEKRFRFSCKAPVQDDTYIKVVMVKEEERFCQPNGLCSRWGPTDAEDGWSDWSPWLPCTADCGGGVQYRMRNCESSVEECQGPSKISRVCNTHSCNGEWGCWTDWSNCSASCGLGIHRRSRTCLSTSNRSLLVNDCVGLSVMEESCQIVPCEDNSEGWTSWSSWSVCDEAINQRHRNRTCLNNALCKGPSRETRLCDDLSVHFENTQTSQLFPFCAISLIVGLLTGLLTAAGLCYYYVKKHKLRVPSSPHYISQQNPYVTVPLKDAHPKRTPSFSKSSALVNGTPKLFSKPPVEYETATIKRNSHSLLNGHIRSSNLEEDDKFF